VVHACNAAVTPIIQKGKHGFLKDEYGQKKKPINLKMRYRSSKVRRGFHFFREIFSCLEGIVNEFFPTSN